MSRRLKHGKEIQNSGFKRRPLVARSPNQKIYIRKIAESDITLAHGPAGSGKTHCAVGAAIHALRKGQTEKIILTRPAVELGNDIGYLPGTMLEKMSPYIRPFFDELSYYCELSKIKHMLDIEIGQLEVVPLSMMRGRTFNDAFILLDEAQNCSRNELRMCMTRIGANSKMIITGDLLQSDLHPKDRGGFKFCIDNMHDIDGVSSVALHAEDIVRNSIIADIEEVFECVES